MTKIVAFSSRTASAARLPVIALHCSGASGRQWRHLAQALAGRFDMKAPDLIGCGDSSHWCGEGPFQLTDEAAGIVDIIDACAGRVHLVGHSYGGGVALRVAIERPNRIASLSLYEPTCFHVLKSAGPDGWAALAEIRSVARKITQGIVSGAYRAAARRFVDYWNGPGAWDGLGSDVQADFVRWIPKAALDFRALIEERIPLEAYRRLRVPMLLMRGETSPTPAQLIVDKLARFMGPRAVEVVTGAGHMGPFTHPEIVNRAIADHLLAVEGQRVEPAQAA